MPNITFIIFLTYWKTFTKFNCLQSNIVSLGLYFRFEPFLPSLLLFPPFTFYWSYTECFLVSSHLSSSLAGNASNLLCRNTVMPPELSSSLWLTLPRISSPSLPFSGHFHFAPTVLHCWKVGSFKEGKYSISFTFTWYTEITKVLKDQLCFFFLKSRTGRRLLVWDSPYETSFSVNSWNLPGSDSFCYSDYENSHVS